MWAEVAYGMPPAKAGVDSRAAQLIGFPRMSIRKPKHKPDTTNKQTTNKQTNKH